MARLSVLLARDVRTALVFRRGPTKQVRQLRWDLQSDTVDGGQWLAGRVYPERCDLSPTAQLLVYFAMRNGAPWTAVSRPGYFTPLALWPDNSTWGGGGRFVGERTLLLGTNPAHMPLDPAFTVPDGFEVGAFASDAPRCPRRDGAPPSPRAHQAAAAQGLRPPQRAHPHPHLKHWALHTSPVPRRGSQAPLFPQAYWLWDSRTDTVHRLGEIDWANWDSNGDLLTAVDGDLRRSTMTMRRVGDTHTVARLADQVFEKHPPSPEATRWPLFPGR